MPRVRFTADPKLPRDWADKPYRKDTEHDMSDDEANRWLRRGVAVLLPQEERPRRGDKRQTDVLHGSSTLPGLIEIGDDRVQLGTIVAAAHERSGLDVAAWNALDDVARDEKLNFEIEAMRAAAEAPVEIPEGWRSMHHMARLALARKLSGDDVENAVDADRVIGEEADRRTAAKTADHHQV